MWKAIITEVVQNQGSVVVTASFQLDTVEQYLKQYHLNNEDGAEAVTAMIKKELVAAANATNIDALVKQLIGQEIEADK
jgi:hypothetical protein